MFTFNNGNHINRSDNNYILTPYAERCSKRRTQNKFGGDVYASGLLSDKIWCTDSTKSQHQYIEHQYIRILLDIRNSYA